MKFTVIPAEGAEKTEVCVDALRAGVKAKKLIGLAYVAIYSGRTYEVHLCGEADRSPTFARGAVQVLDDRCRDRIHGAGA